MTEAERQSALQCLGQVEQLRIVAAAVSPAIEALQDAAVVATGCTRTQALRRMGILLAVANWAAAARQDILQRGDAEAVELLEATQRELDGVCQSDVNR